MLKAIEKLLKEGNDLKVGNHSSKHTLNNTVCSYMYHGTVICEADYGNKEFKLPYDGIYSNSSSTRRAVSDYKRYFLGEGFTLTKEAV